MAAVANIMLTLITIASLLYLFFYFNNRYYLFEYFQATPIIASADIDMRDCAARGGAYANGTCNIPQDADKAHCEKSGGTWDDGRCSIPSVQCGLIGGKYVSGNCVSSDVTTQARINCEMGGGEYSLSTGICREDSARANRFQMDMTENANPEKPMYPGAGEVIMTTLSPPYDQQPIHDLDDYEYNLIYTNESDRVLGKELRDKLMSQYPMNWTTYPPSSSEFQAGYKESFQNATQDVPDDAKPYQNISGSTMAPPDMAETEKEERKILQTYKPEFPPKGATYDDRDANKLIKKMYDAKGLIADVRHKEGTNVYEIVGTRRKNEKVVYEDEEAPVTRRANPAAGEGTVPVVSAVNQLTTSSRDSFYATENNKGSGNPWQYTAWTPGLERVFAPTEPKQNWY
jgi:hypothetical protein